MDEPEDKGPRYRLVMFIAIAAILVPGWLLLTWVGDNGVNNLFRSFLGMNGAARVTRTVLPISTAPATATVVPSLTTTPTAAASASPAKTVTVPPPTATKAPATPTVRPTQAPATQVPAATATPVPPKPTATNAPRPATPTPAGLGWGAAVPAYGGAAVIRAEPDSSSAALASIPLGDRVYVLRIVEGEAIDPVEPRWWQVDYQGVHGFVYWKLIKLD